MGFQTASLSLGPVLALQGLYVRRVTPRLPEPPGPRGGTSGVGPDLRLLLVGDSAVAGVGAPSQDEALSGRLANDLSRSFRLSWTLVARTGATTQGTRHHLLRLAEERFDVAVLSLGGNDVTARRPVHEWLAEMEKLLRVLRVRFRVRLILVSGLPPMHAFPGLPQPLRWYLGATARRFDGALARWVCTQADCEHVPIALTHRGQLATDGLHPGPLGYLEWSALLAQRIRARWVDLS